MAAACQAMSAADAPAAVTENINVVTGQNSTVEFVVNNPEVSNMLSNAIDYEPNNIPAPKFALRTKDNKFVLTLSGKINVVTGGDMGNDLYNVTGAGINFITQSIPVPATSGNRGDWFLNPYTGNVAMQIMGFGGTADQVSGYIKIGTNGINNALRLKRAYITWRGFTAGHKHTLAQDGYACQPATIDPQGPSGCLSTTVNELSYTSPSYKGFRWALGLDMPTYYSSNGVYLGKDYPEFSGETVSKIYAAATQTIPDIPAWVEWGTSTWNRIRLTGLLRNFRYRDLVHSTTRTTQGWGVMLSGNLNPVKPLIFYLQAAYGKGIGNYLQDIAGMAVSYTPKDDEPGHMTPTPMAGLNFGVTYNITPRWQVNAMISESRLWDISEYAMQSTSTNYKYATYAAANVFYNITSYLQWGLEYIYGHRQTWNLGGADDNRLQTQISFSF
jgi:hypothetical protein